MEATKYFIYARKSTKGDERQALSIPAQMRALEKLAQQHRIKVVETITERHSAHLPGRPLFSAMLKRIEAGEASGIIAWHPDRLARNSKDGGNIIYLLDMHKLADLKFSTYWFENTPQGKAQLGHTFVETKHLAIYSLLMPNGASWRRLNWVATPARRLADT